MLSNKSKMQPDRCDTFHIMFKKKIKQYYILFMDSTQKNDKKKNGTWSSCRGAVVNKSD